MKDFKFILIFLAFAGIASCSSDDDGSSNEPPANDPIVGTWKIQQQLIDGEEEPLSDCEKQSTVEFKTNETVTSTDYYDDPDTGECITDVYTEDWENRGNGIYRITDEDDESTDISIVFSGNNNTFTISEEYDEVTYSVTYVRV